jgi:hypothetical protein
MLKILLIGCLFLLSLITKSQEAISFSYNYGDIAIHTSLIEPLIKGPVHGFSVNYALSNKYGTDWRKFYNYANYGIKYNYKDYNNPEHLGASHSVTGFFQLPYLRISHFVELGFEGLTGLGIFTKKYDVYNNTVNKAISSTVNISVETRLYSKMNFHPMFLEYSFGLNHFSNGLIKAPNLGINVFNNSISLGYYLEEEVSHIKGKNQQPERKGSYEIWMVSSMGLKEVDYDSKKYMYSGLTVNFAVFLSQINKSGIGIDFLNDPSLVSYASQYYSYPGHPGFNFRYGINLNSEFIFGKTGFFGGYGIYLKNSDYYSSKLFYKVGFKYYYKNFIGMVLIRASPLFRADVVEFGFGYKFTKYKKQQITSGTL